MLLDLKTFFWISKFLDKVVDNVGIIESVHTVVMVDIVDIVGIID